MSKNNQDLISTSVSEENKAQQPVEFQQVKASQVVQPQAQTGGMTGQAPVKTMGFRENAKLVKKSSISQEDYKEKMRVMMQNYSDAQVLEGLKTLPIAAYFQTFGQSFDTHYGVYKPPSEYQQSYNALANAWVLKNPTMLNTENLKKLLGKIREANRQSGGVHIRNVQVGNLEFVSQHLVLVNIPYNIRVVPEDWTILTAVMLAKKLSEVLKQMREGVIDYPMAKTEVEQLKRGQVVIRNGFGNMVTKQPNIGSQFALVIQHFVAVAHENRQFSTPFTKNLTFADAKQQISNGQETELATLIQNLL